MTKMQRKAHKLGNAVRAVMNQRYMNFYSFPCGGGGGPLARVKRWSRELGVKIRGL